MSIKTKQYKAGITTSEHSRLMPDTFRQENWNHGDGSKRQLKVARFWVNGHNIGYVKQTCKTFAAYFSISHIRGWQEICPEGKEYAFFETAIEAKRFVRERQIRFAEWLLKHGKDHGYKLKCSDIELWK